MLIKAAGKYMQQNLAAIEFGITSPNWYRRSTHALRCATPPSFECGRGTTKRTDESFLKNVGSLSRKKPEKALVQMWGRGRTAQPRAHHHGERIEQRNVRAPGCGAF